MYVTVVMIGWLAFRDAGIIDMLIVTESFIPAVIILAIWMTLGLIIIMFFVSRPALCDVRGQFDSFGLALMMLTGAGLMVVFYIITFTPILKNLYS